MRDEVEEKAGDNLNCEIVTNQTSAVESRGALENKKFGQEQENHHHIHQFIDDVPDKEAHMNCRLRR
jgi:hypothetical protein